MSKNALNQRDEGPEENPRPAKKVKLADAHVFPDEFQHETNSQILSVQPEDAQDIQLYGGHIKGTVIQVFRYKSRGYAGLVMSLSKDSPYLECEVPLNEYSDPLLPSVKDVVYIALKDPLFKILDHKLQGLPFKLVFRDVLLYIEPIKEGSAPRVLEFQKKQGRPPPQQPVAAPSSEPASSIISGNEVKVGHVEVFTPLPSESLEPKPEGMTAVPTAPVEVHRVRKNDVRKGGSLAKKALKMKERAELATVIEPPAAEDTVMEDIGNGPTDSDKKDSSDEQEAPEISESPEDITSARPQLHSETEQAALEPSPQIEKKEPPKPKVYKNTIVQLGVDDEDIYHHNQETGPPVSNILQPMPSNFKNLASVSNLNKRQHVNIIGVVVGLGEIKKARSGDSTMKISLCDQSKPTTPFKVNVFCKQEAWLPGIVVGQIILLSDIRAEEFNGSMTGTGFTGKWKWLGYDHDTQADFFNDESDPEIRLDYAMRPEILDYFKKLGEWYKSTTKVEAHMFEKSSKHKLLSQLKESYLFFNATVEVLNVMVTGTTVFIHVIDYTCNDGFSEGVDSTMPWNMTLRIFVSSEKETFEEAKVIQAGKVYKMLNIRYSGNGEADVPLDAEFRQMRTDSKDLDVQRLIERKEHFEQNGHPIGGAGTSARSAPNPSKPNPKLVKSTSAPAPAPVPVPVSEPLSGEHIVCRGTVPLLTFSEISALPGTGYYFKTTARIIDMAPFDCRDMVCLVCKQCGSRIYGAQNCDKCGTDKHLDFDVRLCFFVVDETHEWMPIRVAGDQARQLFKLESLGNPGAKLDTNTLLQSIGKKLRNVIGNLWTNPPTQDRFKDGVEFDVNALAEVVQSPWIDLIIHSWQEYDKTDGTWITRFNLMDCVFESPSHT